MLDTSSLSDPLAPAPLLPLVEVVELKWLLAGQGVHLHVERLQGDLAYAHATLDRAERCAEPATRSAAARLRRHLPPI